jgi:hypothetical protein
MGKIFFGALAGIALSGALYACAGTGVTPATVSAVSGDVTVLIADIQAATNGAPVTSAQAAVISTELGKLQADVLALNAGGTTTTAASVLGDIATAIADIGPFVPLVEGLLAAATVAPSANAAMTANAAEAPQPYLLHKMRADYAQLQADAGKAKA